MNDDQQAAIVEDQMDGLAGLVTKREMGRALAVAVSVAVWNLAERLGDVKRAADIPQAIMQEMNALRPARALWRSAFFSGFAETKDVQSYWLHPERIMHGQEKIGMIMELLDSDHLLAGAMVGP